MRYFRDKNGEVFGYDKDQQSLIDVAVKSGMIEVTGSWPPKPTPAELTAEANAKIKAQMAALDLKRVRPMAEGDTAYLAKLNKQIAALRAKLK